MGRSIARRGALLLALCVPFSSWALEFRSVTEAAVLYDAPSRQAKRLFVMARQTPVEVVVSVEGWTKVRDAAGDIAWIEKRLLSSQRTLIVAAPRCEVRADPDAKATAVFEAEKDVVLELVEAGPPGWAKVRHRDGQSGFVRVTQVWGL
jgi:SH3-like domain-containing protein